MDGQPGEDPGVGGVLFADFEVDEEAPFYQGRGVDEALARDGSSGTEACEAEPACEEGVVEERIEGEEGGRG